MAATANVLVVDDRADKLLVLGTLLEPLGQNVVLAHSGEEALKAMLELEFAVILMDVNMPTMDGLKLLKFAVSAGMGDRRRQAAA